MSRLAYLVHVYTATGVVCGLLSILATLDGDYQLALSWMVAAVFIDATDGWLARRVHVDRNAPNIDGARLDDIVDYVTYVVAPGLLLLKAGLLPPGWALPVVCAMLLASAMGFSQRDAKTADHYFTGFPSYWNVVALYLLLIGARPTINAIVLLVLSALVFVPIRYVYPTRTETWRVVTLAGCAAWGVQVLGLIWSLPDVPPWLFWSSLAYPIYYTALSFWLHLRHSVDGR